MNLWPLAGSVIAHCIRAWVMAWNEKWETLWEGSEGLMSMHDHCTCTCTLPCRCISPQCQCYETNINELTSLQKIQDTIPSKKGDFIPSTCDHSCTDLVSKILLFMSLSLSLCFSLSIYLPAYWPLTVINNHTCFHGSSRQAGYMLFRCLWWVRRKGRERHKGEGREREGGLFVLPSASAWAQQKARGKGRDAGSSGK